MIKIEAVDTLWDLPYMRKIVGDQDEQK